MTGAVTGGPAPTGAQPTDRVSSRRRLLSAGYAVAAVVLAGLAWWLVDRGVATDSWPAFAPGADHTDITRYSGAWLSAAAGAALAAALLVVGAVRQGVRARATAASADESPQPTGVAG